MSKLTGLAAFTAKKLPVTEPVAEQAKTAEIERDKSGKRKRGSAPTVAMTVRVKRSDWERLHQLAVSEGESIQGLAVRGLSLVFQQKGLPGMAE
jgi:hypothetical protein